MHYHKPQEYQSAINKTYDPYRYWEHPQAQELAQQRGQFGELDHPGYGLRQQFHQQALLDQQRELMRGQMSLRWSDYETNNPCAEIELPNVAVTQRVSKLNTLLKKLKL
jgi:hypothetical protein